MPAQTKKQAPGYYLRFRGQTTGPYSLKQVLDALAQGSISRLHDVSRDQTRWYPIHTHPAILVSDTPEPPAPAQPQASAGKSAGQNVVWAQLADPEAQQADSPQATSPDSSAQAKPAHASQPGPDASTEDLIDSILREPRK